MAKTYWGLPSQCNFFSVSIPRCRTQFCVYKYCIVSAKITLLLEYASWYGSKHIVYRNCYKITMIAEQLCRKLNFSCKNNFLNPSSYGSVYVQINEDICTIHYIMTTHMGNGFLSAFSTKQRKWSNHWYCIDPEARVVKEMCFFMDESVGTRTKRCVRSVTNCRIFFHSISSNNWSLMHHMKPVVWQFRGWVTNLWFTNGWKRCK